MNTKTAICIMLVPVVLTSCLLQPALAESPGNDCKQAKGTWIDVYPGTGNATFGTITNAGVLNGTTQTIFNSGAFPTPVPTTVSYSGDMTITTVNGQLRTNSVYLYDFATGLFTILARINPKTSTGRFAGATGVLFPSGKTIGNGFTYKAEITGEICFPNESAGDKEIRRGGVD